MAALKLSGNSLSKQLLCIVFQTRFIVVLILFVTILVYAEHISAFTHGSGSSSRKRMLEIIADAHQDLVYLHRPDILMGTMAKGGSTSVWNWLYTGLTGRPKFEMKECETYVQNVRSPCWDNEAVHLHRLPEAEQLRILNNPKTLRVAIQRNPFERLVSSWKSKFACDENTYGTDLRNRKKMVPALLRQANMATEGKKCLSIDEFAIALERVQNRVRRGETKWLSSLRKLDVHVRPQNFYFNEVNWDIVLNTKDLKNVERLTPIIERLSFPQLVRDGPAHEHASGGGEILISESAAKRLYNFALESKIGRRKYI